MGRKNLEGKKALENITLVRMTLTMIKIAFVKTDSSWDVPIRQFVLMTLPHKRVEQEQNRPSPSSLFADSDVLVCLCGEDFIVELRRLEGLQRFQRNI